MSDTPEQQKQFAGTFNRPEVHDLLEDGQITTTEFALLAIIESYQGKEGCWLSNATLAKKLGVKNPDHIRSMVKHLKEINLLLQIGWKKVNGRNMRLVKLTSSFTPLFNPGGPPCLIRGKYSSYLLRKYSEGVEASASTQKDDEMDTFFEEDRNTQKITQEALELTKKHRKWVASNHWFVSKDKQKWQTQFQILINDQGSARVQEVLEWYHNNHPEKVYLKLRDAKEFKQQYNLVVGLMEREETRNPQVEISEDAIKAASYVDHLGWPKGTKDQLPLTAQITIDQYHKFRKELKKTRNGSTFAAHVLDLLFMTGVDFAVKWLRDLHKRVANWKDWSGNMIAAAFKPDHKEFAKWGRDIARRWNGRSEEWDKLMEVMYG